MECYIINLKRSEERRAYMENLLQPYTCLHPYQFVSAVDGRSLSEQDIKNQFRQEEARRRYGRLLKKSEVGCTLSHRKCYQRLIETKAQWALVMEDDILIRVSAERLADVNAALEKHLTTSCPTIIILFGEYWWTKTVFSEESIQLKKVYDAISAQGYLINRAAAERLLSYEASTLADDWTYIIEQGVHVMALHPHIIDQEWSSFETTISMDGYASYVRRNLSLVSLLHIYWRGGVRRLLKMAGRFEPHIIPKEEPEWAKRLGI